VPMAGELPDIEVAHVASVAAETALGADNSEANYARLRDVKLGQSYGNTVAVTEGLKEGERVLTTGVTIVNDGEQVKVIP